MNNTRKIIKARSAFTLDPDIGVLKNPVLKVGGYPLRLLTIDSGRNALKGETCPVEDLGDAVLAPGLVNAHVHTANVRFGNHLLMGRGLPAWIGSMIPHLAPPPNRQAMTEALVKMRQSGTVLAADMSDRDGPELASASASTVGPEMLFAVQHFGFSAPGTELPELEHIKLMRRIVPSPSIFPSGHALYSTHPQTMRLVYDWCQRHDRPFFMHLAESPEETRLLVDGDGTLADLFRRTGVLPDDFSPPGLSPTVYAKNLGLLGTGTIAVHCVHLDDEDLALIAQSSTTVCLCPRSNAAIGVGRARFEDLYLAGVRLCLGTDGPGSVPDLNLWNELAFLIKQAHLELKLEKWLVLASRHGAEALGMDREYGRLSPGWRAVWSMVPAEILELTDHHL